MLNKQIASKVIPLSFTATGCCWHCFVKGCIFVNNLLLFHTYSFKLSFFSFSVVHFCFKIYLQPCIHIFVLSLLVVCGLHFPGEILGSICGQLSKRLSVLGLPRFCEIQRSLFVWRSGGYIFQVQNNSPITWSPWFPLPLLPSHRKKKKKNHLMFDYVGENNHMAFLMYWFNRGLLFCVFTKSVLPRPR